MHGIVATNVAAAVQHASSVMLVGCVGAVAVRARFCVVPAFVCAHMGALYLCMIEQALCQ
jgi:hypothetical protein